MDKCDKRHEEVIETTKKRIYKEVFDVIVVFSLIILWIGSIYIFSRTQDDISSFINAIKLNIKGLVGVISCIITFSPVLWIWKEIHTKVIIRG